MSYVTLDDFLRKVLPNQTPTADQQADAQKALDAATAEIDRFFGWTDGTGYAALPLDQQQMIWEANMGRAAEHWKLTPYRQLPGVAELGPVFVAANSWARWSTLLYPLKTADFGVA